MPNLAPWLVCATEGCTWFGRRFYHKFCTDWGSENVTPLPRCCTNEDTVDKGFCAYCGTPKARGGEQSP